MPWWRHQMETFSALPTFCTGNSPITGEFPAQRSMTRNLEVFCYLRLNQRLSKQSRCWWFETPSHSLWQHCNGVITCASLYQWTSWHGHPSVSGHLQAYYWLQHLPWFISVSSISLFSNLFSLISPTKIFKMIDDILWNLQRPRLLTLIKFNPSIDN